MNKLAIDAALARRRNRGLGALEELQLRYFFENHQQDQHHDLPSPPSLQFPGSGSSNDDSTTRDQASENRMSSVYCILPSSLTFSLPTSGTTSMTSDSTRRISSCGSQQPSEKDKLKKIRDILESALEIFKDDDDDSNHPDHD